MDEESDTMRNLVVETFDRLAHEAKASWLDTQIRRREVVLSEYRSLVEHLRSRASTSETDRELYNVALSHLHIDELTHLDLVTVGRHQRKRIVHGDSFFRSIVLRRRKRQLGRVPERHLGLRKEWDHLFAQLLGVRTPTILFTGEFTEVPRDLGRSVLLKPLKSSGAKGAYYVFDNTRIYSIESGDLLTSWRALGDEIVARLGQDFKSQATWQLQELVCEDDGVPARDFKFYAFYGSVGLIREIVRYPSKQYAAFNERFSRVECGREHEPPFQDRQLTIIDKGGVSPEALELVQWMSAQIPAPFMRIDFLNDRSGLVFCEFCAAPGMSHTFNRAFDQRLGKYYNDAEVRLVNDLLAGKSFELFGEFTTKVTALIADRVGS